MADDANAAALADKDRQIADLKAELAAAGSSTNKSDPEDLTPYPTQAQLDETKLGLATADVAKAGGKNRQFKTN